MSYLDNKVVVITGASSGIGAVTATALAAQGARIVAGALDKDGLDAVVAGIEANGGKATAVVTDVTDPRSVERLADHAIATFGTIDILVNNAGLMLFSSWKDRALDDWMRMVDVNIRGYLNSIHAVLPTMLDNKSGHILNMASVAGHAVGEGAGVYSATKFFVGAMTESLRKELGVHEGIRATAISPGVIDTGWHEKVTDPAGRKAAAELVTVAITPDAVASAVVYALDQPANVTVNDLVVSPTRQPW
ncbi:SDR family oxidoreductase [Rhodococcus sp. IEGM 1381]|uniref:SDR family oxidoreductase n=1 Tax=Rhodococcus sp. IEGM 1381 TaxID=3047085 RepID=UPI0024B6CB74|nr:SDR family oxidoreductase [Rhodococcus sp. IEGM 1381]MDI9894529.1 SDR family oxidoreductase [Rhodococcus sp. IEGM 1381]